MKKIIENFNAVEKKVTEILKNFDSVEKMCQKSDANYRKFR